MDGVWQRWMCIGQGEASPVVTHTDRGPGGVKAAPSTLSALCAAPLGRDNGGLSAVIANDARRTSMPLQVVETVSPAHEDGVWSLAWKGDRIFTGGCDDKAKVWAVGRPADHGVDAVPTAVRFLLEDHLLPVVSVGLSSDGNFGVSASMDFTIKLWDFEKLADVGARPLLRSIDCGPGESWTVSLSSDAQRIATGSHTGKIHLYECSSGDKLLSLDSPTGKMVMAQAFSIGMGTGDRLAVGSVDGGVAIVDIEAGKAVSKWSNHSKAVRSLSWAPDGVAMLSASDDGTVCIYDSRQSSTVDIMVAHESLALCVAVSPCGTQVASGGSDKKVRLWDLKTRTASSSLADAHSDAVWSLAWNDAGTRLASASDDKTVNMYQCTA